MSKQHEARRSHGGRARLSGIPAPGARSVNHHLALSGLVHRALLSFGERDQQRRRLLNILVLVQALLLLAFAPAYLGSHPTVPGLIVVACGLALSLAAWAFNQLFQDAIRSTYLLLVGGGLVALAQVFLAAADGRDAVSASFAALLLLIIMLDAGLLVAPEVTGFISTAAITLSAVGLVLAVTFGPPATQQHTYVVVATVLSLQVATALIAWLLSRFIADTAVEAERAHTLQIAQARLDGVTTQAADQRQRIEAGAASLCDTITRALGGDATARAEPLDGELAALASALNQLLERQQEVGPGDQLSRRVDTTGLPLGNLASVEMVGVAPVQADLTRRLLRIQEVAGEVLGGLTHGEQGLASTAQAAAESLRTVGASLAASDALLTAAQKTSDLTNRARRAIGSLLPGDSADATIGKTPVGPSEPLDAAQAAALLGLGPDLGLGGPGMTIQFSALRELESDEMDDEAAAGPLDSSTPASASNGSLSVTAGAEFDTLSTSARRRKGSRSLNAEMVRQINEVSQILAQLHDEAANQERGATALTHELGLTNRHARGVDVGVAWARQALEAIRRNAQRLYQTAGGTVSPFPGGAGHAFSAPMPGDLPARAPLPTRPLAGSGKLSALPDSSTSAAPPVAASTASSEPPPALAAGEAVTVDLSGGEDEPSSPAAE